MTTGTSSTPASEPESAQEPAQTPTPAKPTPPGKPAKLNALTADPPVTEPGGTSLITAEVVNPDSVPLTFSWAASGGSISGADAQALWVAPQSTGEFTISVVVKDSKGRTTSGSIGVYVQGGSSKPAPTPTAPKITALTADPTVTPPGGTSSITAEVVNPDSVPLTFSWAASGGNITGTEAQALWVAPQSTGEFTISVAAKDSYGRTANGSIRVNVQVSSPAPAPTPTPTGTRDPALWPFGPLSIFNHPIGSGAVYVNPQPANRMVFGAAVGFDVARWSKNVWIATSSDPVRSLINGDGSIAVQIRIPDGAYAAGGTDGDIVFIDETHSFAYEAGAATKVGNNWQSGSAQQWWRHDLKGPGTYSSFHSADAWGNAALGGLIRRGELDSGIFHALQAAIHWSALNGGSNGLQGPVFQNGVAAGPGYTWPANSRDGKTVYGTSGNLYLGTLLAIPASVNVERLGITHPWALAIARALQDYGLYLTTVGGINGIIFKADGAAADYFVLPSRTSTSDFNHPFWDGLSKALRELKIVSNNLPATIGGGGTPRRPPAPPFPSRAQALVEEPARPLPTRRWHS